MLDPALIVEWGTEWENLACSVCLACGYHFLRPRRSCSLVTGGPGPMRSRRVGQLVCQLSAVFFPIGA
jgi:hypothetical protein